MRKLRRVLCLLLCVMLLAPCCAAGESPMPEVRVLLRRLALTDRADLTVSGTYEAVCDGTEVTIPDGSRAVVQIREGQLYLSMVGITLRAGRGITFRRFASAAGETGLRFGSGTSLYPGDLRLTVENGVLQPILTLPLEDYLLGVLPSEMGESFPLEALKAQAVCARTYVLSHRDAGRAWDVVDTTNDQVFRGIDARNVNCTRAVQETAGIVGTVNGQLAVCYYSASNGGQTELPGNIWGPGSAAACYAMTEDPYDLENPESVVKRARLNRDGSGLPEAFVSLVREKMLPELARQEYETSRADCFRIDRINAVSLGRPRYSGSKLMTELTLTFSWSGRRAFIPVTGSDDEDFYLYSTPNPAGPAPTPYLSPFLPAPMDSTVTLTVFAGALAALNLSISGANNELLTVREDDRSFILEARRYGHGVGLSQRGAQWMAGHYGMTFDRILAFYYPGMQLMMAGTARSALPTPPPVLFATPAPPATPTPRPTLMPVTGVLPTGAWLASVEGIEDDSSLNLRAEPNGAGQILMRLFKHQRLVVLETCEDPAWVHVKTDTMEGYVMVSFLERVQ